MKVFQIVGGFCFHDATKEFNSAAEAQRCFPPDVLFVDAPDNVFEGWGYEGGEFIQPQAPEGWVYDERTGTFYPVDNPPPAPEPSLSDRVTAVEEAVEILLSGRTE